MDVQALAVGALLALATLPLVLGVLRARRGAVGFFALAVWALASAGLAWAAARWPPPPAAVRNAHLRPAEVESGGYVRSGSCKACHPEQHASWHASFHRTMTTVASRANVLAPWDGVTVQARDSDFVLETRGDEYWVEMDDPEGTSSGGPVPRVRRQVVQITGSHHWQFFWTATGSGRELDLLPVAYRVADEPRWMPTDACCMTPPDTGQMTGGARWNRSCNKCHSTHGQPRIDAQGVADTHVVELGIACEACHGPGAEHVAANRDPRRRYRLHSSGEPDPTIVNPERLDHRRASQVCGHCHGVTRFKSDADRRRWNQEGFEFRPGDDLEAQRGLDREGVPSVFWPDGELRIAGREYTALLGSACFTRGEMSCFSCHTMHKTADDARSLEEWRDDQLAPGMDTDVACTQCHTEYAGEALVQHTRHAPASDGSRCMNCHMPYTNYGLLKAIRSHTIRSPDVTSSVAAGRPNACNQCHLDRTLAWAAEHLEEWYGIAPPALDEDQRTVSATVLWALKGDAGQRALAGWTMGWGPARRASNSDWLTPYLGVLLTDPYHAVRYVAHRSFREQPEFEHLDGYDIMLPDQERFAKALEPYNEWGRRAGLVERTTGASILIAEDGSLDMDTLNRLLAARDLREVVLNE